MKNRHLKFASLFLAVGAAPLTHAAVDWSSQAYDLYFGDFNGDQRSDLLYVAKSPAGASGVDLSDGISPNIPVQSWSSSYLGIPWSGNQYVVTVADFNGDQRADLLLQKKSSGDSYLLFANAQGKFVAIDQTIGNNTAGVTWSADQHRIVAGDFNADGKADVFLQATSSSGLNAVIFADGNGKFTAGSPHQSWNEGFLGLKWSTPSAHVYAGNFDGAGGADLLIQARPSFVMIDYEIPFPVPTYPANMNGLLRAQSTSPVFQLSGLQAWSRNAFGVDWSPLTAEVILGEFNGDGRSDVLLQGKSTGKPSYLLTGNASGSAFSNGTQLASNVTWTADTYKLSAQNFSGAGGGSGVYFQGLTSATSNLYANNVTAASVVTFTNSPTLAATLIDYSYDALGRLVTVARSGAASNNGQTTYVYDAAGNRTTVTSVVTP